MSGALVRKREGRGEKISLPVSKETKIEWEAFRKALEEKRYEIDTDQAVRRIIRSLKSVVSPGRPRRNAVVPKGGK